VLTGHTLFMGVISVLIDPLPVRMQMRTGFPVTGSAVIAALSGFPVTGSVLRHAVPEHITNVADR